MVAPRNLPDHTWPIHVCCLDGWYRPDGVWGQLCVSFTLSVFGFADSNRASPSPICGAAGFWGSVLCNEWTQMPGTNMNGTFARVYVIGLELGVGCMRCALAAVVVVISGISGTCFINQRFMAQISKMELPGNKHNLMGGKCLPAQNTSFLKWNMRRRWFNFVTPQRSLIISNKMQTRPWFWRRKKSESQTLFVPFRKQMRVASKQVYYVRQAQPLCCATPRQVESVFKGVASAGRRD